MRTSKPNEGSTISRRLRLAAGAAPALTSHEGKPREEPGSGKPRFIAAGGTTESFMPLLLWVIYPYVIWTACLVPVADHLTIELDAEQAE